MLPVVRAILCELVRIRTEGDEGEGGLFDFVDAAAWADLDVVSFIAITVGHNTYRADEFVQHFAIAVSLKSEIDVL